MAGGNSAAREACSCHWTVTTLQSRWPVSLWNGFRGMPLIDERLGDNEHTSLICFTTAWQGWSICCCCKHSQAQWR